MKRIKIIDSHTGGEPTRLVLASYALEDGQVIPPLRGRAHMSAEAALLIEEGDPFAWGIRL